MRLLEKLAVTLALLCAGCVSTAELSERSSAQAPLPPDTRSATIRALPMQPGASKNVEGVADAPRLLADYVKDALVAKHPDWRVNVADGASAAGGSDVAITLEVLDIEGGNAALRFWIGLGTGATQSVAKVSTADKAGKTLASGKISEQTSCPIGACTETNDEMVRRNLQQLAAEIVAFVLNPAQYEKDRQTRSSAGE